MAQKDTVQDVTAQFGKAVDENVTKLQEFGDKNVSKFQEFSDKLVDDTKRSVNVSLDAYEKTLANTLDLQKKIASETKLEWFETLVGAQASFVAEVNSAATSALREVLR